MRITTGLLLIVAAMTACSRERPAAETAGTVPVVATLYPVASILSFVGDGAVTVRTLLPPGALPDTYEPTPRTAEELSRAALVVRVGGSADDWVQVPPGVDELVLTEGIPLIGQHGPGTGNPHVWLDPILVRDSLLPRMTEALARVAPDSAAAIRRRAADFADSLTVLNAEIERLLASARGAAFVTTHPAWVYFARRYGLEEVGSIHPSPGSELGTRDLARLVDESRELHARVIIAEPQLGAAGAEALASELHLAVVVADPLGRPDQPGRENYLSLMRYNARAFARGLEGAGT